MHRPPTTNEAEPSTSGTGSGLHGTGSGNVTKSGGGLASMFEATAAE